MLEANACKVISGSWRSLQASCADKHKRTDSAAHPNQVHGKCGGIRRSDRRRFLAHRQVHGSIGNHTRLSWSDQACEKCGV